jgi:hypothetical protein
MNTIGTKLVVVTQKYGTNFITCLMIVRFTMLTIDITSLNGVMICFAAFLTAFRNWG